MTDITFEQAMYLCSQLEHDHECSPTRLFEWIQQGIPIMVTHKHSIGMYDCLKFQRPHGEYFILHSSWPIEFITYWENLIYNAMKQRGYRWHKQLDATIYSTDRPDWALIAIDRSYIEAI